VDVLGGHDDPELAVDFDDIAFAQRTSDDSHGFLNINGLQISFRMLGRNILILCLAASYFSIAASVVI
jgi:hypothetical protein